MRGFCTPGWEIPDRRRVINPYYINVKLNCYNDNEHGAQVKKTCENI